jgi:hypothetical protein
VSNFKQQIQDDIGAVFLNRDEFAEMHTVEGRKISVVLDDDKLIERQGGAELGVAESSLLLYAKSDDLPPRRNPGAVLNFDGREYTVDSWTVAQGMATIALSEPRTI